MVPPVLTAPSMPLQPYLAYYLDESGEMDEKEVTAPGNADNFHQFDLKKLPPKTGALWLRFTLAPLSGGAVSAPIFLDLGESVPGVSAFKHKLSSLPKAGQEPQTCLIRLDGVPGTWFSPVLRSPENTVDNWGISARSAGIIALAVVMALCLLRCLTEKGQWRFWTAVYVGAALAQAVLGIPATDHGRVESEGLAAAMMPGLALMLYAHIGRHLTGVGNKSLNVQFFLLSLPGAALALAPLWPDFAWLTRYLELWPAGLLLYVPSALWAALAGLPCSRRFLLGCLLPPIFTAAGFMLAGGDTPGDILASAPLWGTALSAMIIATTSAAGAVFREKRGGSTDNREHSATNVYTLEAPLADPNLRLIPAQTEREDAHDATPVLDERPSSSYPLQNLVNDSLRIPLERLMREGAALEHCALPPAVRQYAANMLAAGRQMTDIISNPLKSLQSSPGQKQTTFNLQHLMRNVHDSIVASANDKNIGLAWYMPPYLEHMYEGEFEDMEQTLRSLLESAVRATEHGAVQFSVKRVPESTDAGHLLFTIKDTGSGMPPQKRSCLALAQAWELAGSHNGFLGLECSPQGTTIAFTLHLKCLGDETPISETNSLPHVIITAESAVDRQLLSHMLKSLPCKCSETRSLHEAMLLHKENPAPLFILHGRFADATASLLRQLTDIALSASLPFCRFLGITQDDGRWDAMAQEGFTHALQEPIDSESFCITVREILDDFLQKAATDESGETTEQAVPEETADAGSSPQSGETKDEAAPTESRRQPVPDLFSTSMSDTNAQIRIPDLTALPDLLSFAESLRSPGAVSSNSTQKFVSTDTFNGLFRHSDEQTTPASATVTDQSLSLDLSPSPEPSRETQAVSEFEKLTLELPKPIDLAEFSLDIQPTWQLDQPTPAQAENEGPKEAIPDEAYPAAAERAEEDDSAADAGPKPAADEQQTEEQQTSETSSQSKQRPARRRIIRRAPPATADEPPNLPGQPVQPLFDANDKTDGGGSAPVPVQDESPPSAHGKLNIKTLLKPRKDALEEQQKTTTPSPAPETPDAPERTIQPDVGPADRVVEWVGEPTPIPAGTATTPSHLHGKLNIKSLLKPKEDASENREALTVSREPIVRTTTAQPAPEKQSAAVPPSQTQAPAAASKLSRSNAPFMDFIADVASAPSERANSEHDRATQYRQPPTEELAPVPQSRREADNAMSGLVERLDKAVADAQNAFTQRRAAAVAEAAGRIAGESDGFGLRVLARMARCVERAARANDMNALKDLLPELTAAVERNRIALSPRS
jgi:signal transduction histidine kinase